MGAEKLDVDRHATEAVITSLANDIEHVDKFMQCFSEEVQVEKAEADRIFEDQVKQLQSKQAAFVDINEDSMFPEVGKVEGDLAAVRKRFEERASSDAADMDLVRNWDSVKQSLPTRLAERQG